MSEPSPDASGAAESLVQSLIAVQRRMQRFFGYSLIAVLLVWIAIFTQIYPGIEPASSSWVVNILKGFFFFFIFGVFAVAGWWIICAFFWDRIQWMTGLKAFSGRAINKLAETDDPRHAGTLLEVVSTMTEQDVGYSAYSAAREKLGRILSHAKSADDLALTQGQRSELYTVLAKYSAFVLRDGDTENKYEPKGHPRTAFDQSLSLACLHAYGFLNDPRALARIRELAESVPTDNQVVAWRVVNAARQILPDLERRVRQEENAGRDGLLHPVDKPTPASALLRPSKGKVDSEEGSALLRIAERRTE